MLPPPPSSTLFPYTTLFRSDRHPRALPPSRLAAVLGGVHARHAGGSDPAGREGRAQSGDRPDAAARRGGGRPALRLRPEELRQGDPAALKSPAIIPRAGGGSR